MDNVTMKSTKQEIFDALQKAVAENKQMREVCTSKDMKAANESVLKAAAKDVENNIFSTEMKEKFDNLTKAIEIQEAKLKELYGIEQELLTLETVVNASKALTIQMRKEEKDFSADIENQKQKKRDEYDALQESLRESYKQSEKSLMEQHRRSEEEYKYNLSRKRKLEEDTYADEKAARDKADAEKKAELDARENAIKEQEEEIRAMREEIAGIEEKVKDSYDKGYDAGEKAAGKEYGFKKVLTEKEHEFAIKTLESKVTILENTVDEKERKIESLEDKLDAAYAHINSLATSTVEASGNIKVLGNVSGAGK